VTGPLGAGDAFTPGRKAESPVFLITRCEEADEALTDALSARGAHVLRLPLLEYEAGPDLPQLDAWIEAAPAGAALAWTSRRAGAALAERTLPHHADRIRSFRLFALGSESAAPAVRAGLSVEMPEDPVDARRLAAHLRAQTGLGRMALLLGDRALPDLREGLAEAGFAVETFVVYRTRFVDADVSEVRCALAADRLLAAAFLSPSGAEALERLLSPAEVERLHRGVVAVAKGGTTLRALRKRGYARVVDPGALGLAFEACALDVLDSLMRTRSA
jgi:uroporphyrinogen-III synthase